MILVRCILDRILTGKDKMLFLGQVVSRYDIGRRRKNDGVEGEIALDIMVNIGIS